MARRHGSFAACSGWKKRSSTPWSPAPWTAIPWRRAGSWAGRWIGQERPRSTACYPTANVAASARVYEVEPRGLLRADRAAEAAGRQLIGVYHSHTHTDAQPSPTDVGPGP